MTATPPLPHTTDAVAGISAENVTVTYRNGHTALHNATLRGRARARSRRWSA